MGAGMAGIMLGATVASLILSRWLPEASWQGFGALAATWTGGSFNMLAIQTALNIPGTRFAPLILVDALIAYSWMAVLMALSPQHQAFTQWLRATPLQFTPPTTATEPRATPHQLRALVLGLMLAVGLAWGSQWIAGRLPAGGVVTSTAGWTVIVVTTAALGLSLAPAVRRLAESVTPAGYALLYVVLAALGAQASVRALLATPAWLLAGLSVVAVHAVTLLGVGRLVRVPFALLATASQANIGGVVSAPLVAAVYDRRLVPVGLLLALAGNGLGTYVGLLVAYVCRTLG